MTRVDEFKLSRDNDMYIIDVARHIPVVGPSRDQYHGLGTGLPSRVMPPSAPLYCKPHQPSEFKIKDLIRK